MAEKNRRDSRRAIDGLRNLNRKHRVCTSVQSQKRMDNFVSDKTDKPKKQQKSPSEARGSGLNKKRSGHRENYFRQSREVKKSVETAKYKTRKPSGTTICGQTSVRYSMPRSTTPGKRHITSDRNLSTKTSTKTTSTQTQRCRLSKGMRRVAPTAYAFFVKAYFSEFRKKNPEEKIHFTTISRRCAEKWHSLPNPIKEEFYKIAEKAANSFNRQKVALHKSNKPPKDSMRTSKASKTTVSKQPNKFANTNTQQNATTTCNKRRTKKKSSVLIRPTKLRHNTNCSIHSSRRRN